MALVLFTVVGLPSVSQSQVVRFPTAVRPGLADKAIISASIHMRFYLTDLDADSHDIRGQQARQALVYHADTDAAGQHLAKTLRAEDSAGIIYSSVGHTQGECVGVFRPRVLSNCRQERHLSYVWDGKRIRDVYEKKSLSGSAT